jgi:hypothetical protein
MPVIAPLWAWLVGLLGSVVTAATTFWVGRVAIDRAFQYALVTAFIVASTGLFLALTLTIKAAILGARITMPQSLGAATFFLPGSTAQLFGLVVTLRVSASVYRWTVATMSAYLPAGGNHRMMGI